MNKLIPCSLSLPEPSATVTWISGNYSQSCYIARKYRKIGGVQCAYIGYLFDDGSEDTKRGIAIVPVCQLFISPAEVEFMSNVESFK